MTAAAAAAAASLLANPPASIAVSALASASASASSDVAPASLMPSSLLEAGSSGSGSSSGGVGGEKQSAILDRLSKLMQMVLGGGAAGSAAAAGINASPAAMAALSQAQSLVQAAQQNGGKLDSATRKMLKEAMSLMMPGGRASLLSGGASSKLQQPSQTEKERFFRNHTMIAECGLVPLREVGTTMAVKPLSEEAVAAAALAAASSLPSASSSSSSSDPTSSRPLPPLFPLLLVYDELSRFTLDALSLSPELVLSADGLGITMTLSDNKWQTVRSVHPFTTGRHMWKVKLDRCAGGNVFLGVANVNMKLNNYIGSDSNGYGFYGCGNIYRSGSSSSFGQSYRSGDTITCKLDMDARTLSYEKNDQPLGVAFTDLPEAMHPAFSLYTKNDFIQIVEFGTF